jgi:hypothetical protein
VNIELDERPCHGTGENAARRPARLPYDSEDTAAQPPASNPELTAILLRGHESKDLDYKSAAAWSEADKRSCCELVKDILAMANTLGGFIIVGVSEQATGFSFDGVSPDQAKTFDTSRVNRFLQSYADPPINARLRKVRHDGRVFVVIEVPAFSDTPHICQKEYPGVLSAPTLYVRTDNNESAPVRSSTDFKSVVERAVRNRGDALLASFRSILTSGETPPEPSARVKFLKQRQDALTRFAQLNPLKSKEPLLGYLEATFVPEQFESARFTLPTLRAAAERAHVTYAGWPFLYIHANTPDRTYTVQDGWETLVYTKDFGGDDLLDFWRFQQSGLFYHRTTLRPTASAEPDGTVPVADLKNIAVYVGEAIDCLMRLYDGLFEDTEYVSFVMRILNTDGRALVNARGSMPLFDTYTCRIPEIVVERRLPLADWRAAVVDHAVAIVNEIYLRFNWPNPNLGLARNAIERTFARQW